MRPLLIAALLVACHKDDPGPPCPQVVDHMAEVTKQGLTGHSTVELANRNANIAYCEQKFSKAARVCLAAAKDLAAMAGCRDVEPPPPAAGSGTPPP